MTNLPSAPILFENKKDNFYPQLPRTKKKHGLKFGTIRRLNGANGAKPGKYSESIELLTCTLYELFISVTKRVMTWYVR